MDDLEIQLGLVHETHPTEETDQSFVIEPSQSIDGLMRLVLLIEAKRLRYSNEAEKRTIDFMTCLSLRDITLFLRNTDITNHSNTRYIFTFTFYQQEQTIYEESHRIEYP